VRQTLSGLVAKGNPYHGHKHNWQRTDRRKTGVVFHLFICTEHAEPEIRAYDMTVMNATEFQGAYEYKQVSK
jgi:hypothetical protein